MDLGDGVDGPQSETYKMDHEPRPPGPLRYIGSNFTPEAKIVQLLTNCQPINYFEFWGIRYIRHIHTYFHDDKYNFFYLSSSINAVFGALISDAQVHI